MATTKGMNLSRKLLRGASKNERTIRIVAACLSICAGIVFAYALFDLGTLDAAILATASTNKGALDSLHLARTQEVNLAIATGVLQVCGQAFLAWLPRAEAEASSTILDMLDSLEKADTTIERSMQMFHSTKQALAILDGICGRDKRSATRDEIKHDIGCLLGPFCEEPEARSRIFSYQPADYWNFTVYIDEPQQKMLRAIWRHCHRHFGELGKKLGRDWGYGLGHVGECFEQKKIIVASNLQAAHDMPANDRELYASALSLPIFCGKDEVCGVCAITGNRPLQFAIDHKSGIRHEIRDAAETIGQILSVYMSYLKLGGTKP